MQEPSQQTNVAIDSDVDTTTPPGPNQSSANNNGAVVLPTDAALFLKNLRFLGLDLLPDWPNITVNTFRAVKDAHLTQKERVRCAEWALFKLFEIWDAQEAEVKLLTYFPALEPRQSIKLRNALYQDLNQLKITGILGRECILRKSTLDECKGSKFEELLFVFSTVVLKKHLNTQRTKTLKDSEARRLTFADTLNIHEAERLEPLIITYKKDLDRVLEARRKFQGQAGVLERTLGSTLADLDAKATATDAELNWYEAAFEEAKLDISKMESELRGERVDNSKWLNTVINGDSKQDHVSLIEDSFSNIWTRITHDQPLAYPSHPKSILEDLEGRIQEQNERLARWRTFQTTVSERNEKFARESPMKSPLKSPRKFVQTSPLKTPRKTAAVPFSRTPKAQNRKGTKSIYAIPQSPVLPTARLMRETASTELSVIFADPTPSLPRPLKLEEEVSAPNRKPGSPPQAALLISTTVSGATAPADFDDSMISGNDVLATLCKIENVQHTMTEPLPIKYEFEESSSPNRAPIPDPNDAESATPSHVARSPRPHYATGSLTERTLATLSQSTQRQATRRPEGTTNFQHTSFYSPTKPSVDPLVGDELENGYTMHVGNDDSTTAEPAMLTHDVADRDMVFRTRSKLRVS